MQIDTYYEKLAQLHISVLGWVFGHYGRVGPKGPVSMLHNSMTLREVKDYRSIMIILNGWSGLRNRVADSRSYSDPSVLGFKCDP